jgi:kinesin family member C1
VERAGEPARPITEQFPRSSVKGTSLIGAGVAIAGARNASFASSTSSRSASISSRHVSGSSFANSVGPGTRAPTSFRDKSQVSTFSQSTAVRPLSHIRSQSSTIAKRPASSMDDHMETESGQQSGKRQGMNSNSNLSSITSVNDCHLLRCKKLRGSRSVYTFRALPEGQSAREVSVSTAMSKLRIGDAEHSCRQQAYSSSLSTPYTPKRKSKSSSIAAMRKSKVENSSSALVLFQSDDRSLVTPKTPSQVLIPPKAEASVATPATPSRIQKQSQKTPFLTKGSNVTAFTAWDVHGRLEDMESMYSELKRKLDGTSMERNGLEEAVAVYKARCKFYRVKTCVI